MSTKHTSGPWTIEPHYCECYDRSGETREGFDIEGPESLGDMECGAFSFADARLISSAPELLAELKVARSWIPSSLDAAKRIDALIAKAEGGGQEKS